MTNHRIIYDSYWTNNLRGVASQSITILKMHENLKVPQVMSRARF